MVFSNIYCFKGCVKWEYNIPITEATEILRSFAAQAWTPIFQMMYVREGTPKRYPCPLSYTDNTFSSKFLFPKRGVIAFPEISNSFDISNFYITPLVFIYLKLHSWMHYGLSLILMVSRSWITIYYLPKKNVIHHSPHY